jgi:hypothetical protein
MENKNKTTGWIVIGGAIGFILMWLVWVGYSLILKKGLSHA